MKMYLEILLIIIAVIIVGYLFFYYADILLAPNTLQSLENQVCFGLQCFSVQLAETSAERERGLMYVKQLGKNNGMLFVFGKEDIYPFWMKNTLIPLDMIWMDSNYKVVYTAQNVQPCKTFICPTINPGAKAKYALEVNAGISEKNGIKVGSIASFLIK